MVALFPCLHSILIDSLFLRKRQALALLCFILWSSALVCVFRIAGIRRWFPISMSALGFGRPIWLVQLSLLEASALVRLRTLRPPISYSQSIFFLFFLSIGRLCADRCLPGDIGALWGIPFRWVVPLSVFSIQCPHCIRKSSSSIFLRNQRNKEV